MAFHQVGGVVVARWHRELSIRVSNEDGLIYAAVYWNDGTSSLKRLSATRFTSWAGVLKLVARFEREHPAGRVFIRH